MTWTALGVGAATLAGGAVFGVLAGSAADELETMKSEPHSRADIESQHDTAETYTTTANVLYGVGVSVLAAGVILWLLEDDKPTSSVSPTSTGVAIRW